MVVRGGENVKNSLQTKYLKQGFFLWGYGGGVMRRIIHKQRNQGSYILIGGRGVLVNK